MHIEQCVVTTTLHILHSVHTGTTFHILHSVQEQLSTFCTVYRNNNCHVSGFGKINLEKILSPAIFLSFFFKQTIPS
jgi:hypothetical protein